MKIKPFDTLKNGALVLAIEGEVVLCAWRDEYVTWVIGPHHDTYWGHYFGADLDAAVADFERRKK